MLLILLIVLLLVVLYQIPAIYINQLLLEAFMTSIITIFIGKIANFDYDTISLFLKNMMTQYIKCVGIKINIVGIDKKILFINELKLS